MKMLNHGALILGAGSTQTHAVLASKSQPTSQTQGFSSAMKSALLSRSTRKSMKQRSRKMRSKIVREKTPVKTQTQRTPTKMPTKTPKERTPTKTERTPTKTETKKKEMLKERLLEECRKNEKVKELNQKEAERHARPKGVAAKSESDVLQKRLRKKMSKLLVKLDVSELSVDDLMEIQKQAQEGDEEARNLIRDLKDEIPD